MCTLIDYTISHIDYYDVFSLSSEALDFICQLIMADIPFKISQITC